MTTLPEVLHTRQIHLRPRLFNKTSKVGSWRAFYYTAIVENPDFSPIGPLIDWLSYNGNTGVTKPAKEFDDGAAATRRQPWAAGSHSTKPR